MAIEKNSIVKVIGGVYEGKTGTICDLNRDIDVAMVAFDDGDETTFRKIPLSDIVEVPPHADRIVDVEVVIPEGAKKISRADFEAALKRVASPARVFDNDSPNFMSNFLASVTTMLIGTRVTNVLFKDLGVVVMTEDEFISALWGACDPVFLADSVDNKMSSRKCITMAMTAFISFKKIIESFFGAKND